MKIGFIVVLFKTPDSEVNRLEDEIIKLGFEEFEIYFIDHTKNNRGYATGVNEGIRRALSDKCQLLIVANPDISLKNLKTKDILAAGKYFDLWGFAMKQKRIIYYGGNIDLLRLSGALWKIKPRKRFSGVSWISGSLFCVKREVVNKIGLFDEIYGMYYEDVDFCFRAGKAGYKLGIDRDVLYEHFEKSSKNPEKEKLLRRARWKFFRKYANVRQTIYEFLRSPKTLLEIFWDDKKSSGFLVNFFSLNLSSLVNKILNFILFIFLIRYLKTSEYGIYALVWAQVAIFSPIVDLGTTSYGIVHLPTEKKKKFISMFNLRLITSIIVFFLTIFAGLMLFRSNTRIVGYIFFTSFVIFSNMLSGSYLIKNAIEGKLYNSSLVSAIFNLVLISILCLSVIIFRSLPILFIFIFILYNLYSFANYFLIKKDYRKFSFTIDLFSWKNFLKKSYVYVLISFFAGLYFKFDIFLLQILKGETEVGIYSAGYKFFEATLFIAASYNIARTPIFARLVKKDFRLFISALKKDFIFLSTLGISIALFTFWLSPLFLPIFLKGNYLSSILVLRIVIFTLPFILINSTLLNALYVLQKAHLVTIVFLFQFLLNLSLNLFFIPKYSYIAPSYITVLSEFLNFIILAFIFFKILKANINAKISL